MSLFTCLTPRINDLLSIIIYWTNLTLILAGFSESIVLQHLSTSMLVLKTKLSPVSLWNFRLIWYVCFGDVEGES